MGECCCVEFRRDDTASGSVFHLILLIGSPLLAVFVHSVAHHACPVAALSGALDLARAVTGLGKMRVVDALEHFAAYADDGGCLDAAAFNACFDEISDPVSPDDHEFIAARRMLLERLFLAFDVNRDGSVDTSELVAGLSVLCQGDADEKFESAFVLFGERTLMDCCLDCRVCRWCFC